MSLKKRLMFITLIKCVDLQNSCKISLKSVGTYLVFSIVVVANV